MLMNVLREEVATVVATTVTTSTTAVSRTALQSGAVASRVAAREFSTTATQSMVSSITQTTMTRELPALAEGTMLRTAMENGSTGGRLAGVMERTVESDLSLVVREALSNSAEQGVEETVEKLPI